MRRKRQSGAFDLDEEAIVSVNMSFAFGGSFCSSYVLKERRRAVQPCRLERSLLVSGRLGTDSRHLLAKVHTYELSASFVDSVARYVADLVVSLLLCWRCSVE